MFLTNKIWQRWGDVTSKIKLWKIVLHLSDFLSLVLNHLSYGDAQFSSALSLSHVWLWPYEPQHARPPCPSPNPEVHTNPRPCIGDAIQPSHPVIPFSSCPQSFPASGSFPMSQLFTSGGRSIGVSASASVPPMGSQDWFPLGWTGLISLLI